MLYVFFTGISIFDSDMDVTLPWSLEGNWAVAALVVLKIINGNFEADYLKSHSYRKTFKVSIFSINVTFSTKCHI